jgi:hypothetical protein
MSDSDILEEEPGPAPALYRASMERTSGRRGEKITNADQISLLNSSIEIAVKRQSDNFDSGSKFNCLIIVISKRMNGVLLNDIPFMTSAIFMILFL